MLPQRASLPLATNSRWLTIPVNGWHEKDVAVAGFIGGVVWDDRDGDGRREAGELPLASVLLYLESGPLTPIDAVLTAIDGSYCLVLPGPESYTVRVAVPSGSVPSPANQATDDTLDSDVDTITGRTAPILPPHRSLDEVGWSAGLQRIGPCIPPDEPIFIYGVRLGLNNATILDYQYPNQPERVTGYNAYRSSNPSLPRSNWTVMGTDVQDMDAGSVNLQWADSSGAQPPLGTVWYYDLTAFNDTSGAEGR